MIKFERINVSGWEPAIRGMRNPVNSWDMDDSTYNEDGFFYIGRNNKALMEKLSKAGDDHSKYLRMITVYVDITAPLYWWKEFDTYKVGTVANSCSTMHKIHSKEFTLDDFSIEHLTGDYDCAIYPYRADGYYGYWEDTYLFEELIQFLNVAREKYNETNDKKYWWQMIQLLPSSYNQKRTVMLNYQVLKNIYHSRQNHKLDEWCDFCKWIESLPYSEIIQ